MLHNGYVASIVLLLSVCNKLWDIFPGGGSGPTVEQN